MSSRLDFDNKTADIKERAELAELAYERFREMQVQDKVTDEGFAEAKDEVWNRLTELRSELDAYLSGDYGIPPRDKVALKRWQESHRPFHWFVEFYGIMQKGGFQAVIGNPPYVERRVIQADYGIRHFATEATNNLFAYVSERSATLLRKNGYFGFIIPVSSISTDRFAPLQSVFRRQKTLWLSHYDDRPSRLFDGIEHARLTIVLYERSNGAGANATVFSTKYNKWYSEERERLFATLEYTSVNDFPWSSSIAKIGSPLEAKLIRKLFTSVRTLEFYEHNAGEHVVYYTRKISAFLNILSFVPEIHDGRGRVRAPSELKTISFGMAAQAEAALCLLNSTLCRWLIVCLGDCRNLNRRDVVGVPVELDKLVAAKGTRLRQLSLKLTKKLSDSSEIRSMRFQDEVLKVQCIIPRNAKDIIDQIDCELAGFLQLDQESLDFVINYEYKYRMGADAEDESRGAAAAN